MVCSWQMNQTRDVIRSTTRCFVIRVTSDALVHTTHAYRHCPQFLDKDLQMAGHDRFFFKYTMFWNVCLSLLVVNYLYISIVHYTVQYICNIYVGSWSCLSKRQLLYYLAECWRFRFLFQFTTTQLEVAKISPSSGCEFWSVLDTGAPCSSGAPCRNEFKGAD